MDGGPRKPFIEIKFPAGIFCCIFCAPKNPPNWVWKLSPPKNSTQKRGWNFDTQTDGPLDVKEWPLPRVFCGKSFRGSKKPRWRNVAGKISGISPLKKKVQLFWVGFIEMTPVHIQFEKHLCIFFSKTSVFFGCLAQKKPVMTRRQVMRFKVGFYQKLNCITTPWNGLVTTQLKNKRWRPHFFGQFFLWSILLSPFSFFLDPGEKKTNGRYDSTLAKQNAAGPSKEAESPSQMDR